MESQPINSLQRDPTNPRQISKTDFENLKQAIVKFGDLSGIVFNARTQQLVGGHQRYEAFQRLDGQKNISITTRFEQPTAKGTVALGYVMLEGESFAYREVDWNEATQKSANIAANRIAGEWDMEKLAQADQWLIENAPELVKYTGQSEDEINQLLGNSPADDSQPTDDRTTMHIKLLESQAGVIDQAIMRIRAQHNMQATGNDDMEANAIYYICKEFLTNQPEPAAQPLIDDVAVTGPLTDPANTAGGDSPATQS